MPLFVAKFKGKLSETRTRACRRFHRERVSVEPEILLRNAVFDPNE